MGYVGLPLVLVTIKPGKADLPGHLRRARIVAINASGALPERVLEGSIYHGVMPLLFERLNENDAWPGDLRRSIRIRAIGHAMWEMRHERGSLSDARCALQKLIRPVLFKGSALSYWLYPNPGLRTCGHTDLVVPPDQMLDADRALTGTGFIRDPDAGAEVVSYHSSYSWSAADGTMRPIKVHSQH
jgi:hypothetical protein